MPWWGEIRKEQLTCVKELKKIEEEGRGINRHGLKSKREEAEKQRELKQRIYWLIVLLNVEWIDNYCWRRV